MRDNDIIFVMLYITVEGGFPKGQSRPLLLDWAAEAPDLVVFVSGTWVSEAGAQE